MTKIRESISLSDIDWDNCYFNPGCAMALYKPNHPERILNLINKYFKTVKLHDICCRHEPKLPKGSTIINNCAGCDRRFRSLYDGIQTISLWEILDSVMGIELPDHNGLTVSVHDSCGYRHKPQVHEALRNLLKKMNVEIIETEFNGVNSICCGDNLYGHVSNEDVEKRIQMRANQFPCENVSVHCIGCVRAMTAGGKVASYLPDLILNEITEPMLDTLDEYHSKMLKYIETH